MTILALKRDTKIPVERFEIDDLHNMIQAVGDLIDLIDTTPYGEIDALLDRIAGEVGHCRRHCDAIRRGDV